MSSTILVLLVSFLLASFSHSLPLTTSSRWIVDAKTRERVKLACVNWPGHMEAMLPEGLNKNPINQTVMHISSMGFNCVRLTYAIHMLTRHANLTVTQHFSRLGFKDAICGIKKNNPEFLDLTLVDAQKTVVETIGSHGVMVLLDNHVSFPKWCCGDIDGNGFFGDKYFGTGEWLQGLRLVARRYKKTPMVIGMSLRNELRGPGENVTEWFKYVEKGTHTIHKANPNVLVLVSGFNYDIDFSFLKETPLKLNLNKKMVYEMHRYAFTQDQGQLWINQTLDKQCQNITRDINEKAMFLLEKAPIFVTEFGIDQTGGPNTKDNLFLGCYLNLLAEHDLDWGVWGLQGSYYFRDGKQDTEETFGMLNKTWTSLRSPAFLEKLQLIQHKLQEPRPQGVEHRIMFHPHSGRCARVDNGEVFATDCRSRTRWTHAGDGSPITLMNTPFCLTAVGDGLPLALSTNCMSAQSNWKVVSNYQLASVDECGNVLCLEWDPSYNAKILTRKCKEAKEHPQNDLDNPQIQWFTLVHSNTQ